VLSTTPEGQEIIKLYYELSPMIVKMMEENEEFKEQTKEMIDRILGLIQDIALIIGGINDGYLLEEIGVGVE
jgi:hypothetical protein